MKNILSYNTVPSFDMLRMTGINVNFLIIISLFVISSTFSELKAEQVTPDAYYNSIKHEYTLNSDGSIIYNYEQSIKLLSYMSFNRVYGESFVTYNPDWQELTITKSETKTSDGSIINSPFNAFNKVLPGHAGQAAPYMNMREMVVTHTGLEKNSEINFSYTLATKKGYFPGLIGQITIGDHDPIKNFEIVLKVPKDTKINIYMSNGGPVGEKSTKDNYDYYIWKLKDIPLIPIETNQPNMELFMPTLYFSTATNSDIVNHLAINNEKIFTLSEKTKNICNEIIKNQFSFQDKCFSLRDYVYQNIGQTNINLQELGWNVLEAQRTFDENVGSKLDRAILLTAMFRAIGIKAELAISSNFTNAKPDITLLSQFGEYLVYCTPDSEKDLPLLLDPNNIQNSILPESVVRKPSFVIASNKISLIPATNENGSLSFSTNLKITGYSKESTNPEIIEGQAKIIFSGDYIPDFDNEKSNKTVENVLKKNKWTFEDKGKNQVAGNEFSKDFSLKKNIDKKLDDIIELELPMLFDKTQEIELIPTSRVTPYEINSIIEQEYNLNIELPDNLKSLFAPEEINISNSVGSLISNISINKNRIIIKRNIKINKILIAPEDYHYLYNLISAWRNKYHNRIFLK